MQETAACNGHGTPARNERIADEVAAETPPKIAGQ